MTKDWAFKKIAKALSEESGKDIDIEKDWVLYLPKKFSPVLGEPTHVNVLYLQTGDEIFAARMLEEIIWDNSSVFSQN